MNGCATIQAAFAAIKLESMWDTSNLEDLDEEDIGNTFTNMRRPPPTVTTSIGVPFQGVNVSAKSQKRLIVASRAARHYKSVVRDLKPAMMQCKVFKDIYVQITAL